MTNLQAAVILTNLYPSVESPDAQTALQMAIPALCRRESQCRQALFHLDELAKIVTFGELDLEEARQAISLINDIRILLEGGL